MALNYRPSSSFSLFSRYFRYTSKSYQARNLKTKSSTERTWRKRGLISGGVTLIGGVVGVVGYVVGKQWKISFESVPPTSLCHAERNTADSDCDDESQIRAWRKEKKKEKDQKERLQKVIDQARDQATRIKDEVGSPGLAVSVSVDGKLLWCEGFGYSDVENRLACTPDTVMRIASISKPITMAIVGKLMEAGQIDIDKSVKEYVASWPDKQFKGDKVTITTRQLVSHLGGVRHYDKSCKKGFASAALLKKKKTEKKEEKNEKNEDKKETDIKDKKKPEKSSEFDLEEYHIKDHYKTVSDALALFKNDDLCSLPGTDFLYTTHGWSLISAVAEGASGHDFPTLLKGFFKDMGMTNTYLDENDPIIYNRSRFYVKNERGRLKNAPYVDCSYKWAGGGLLSTTNDLIKFGNAMLYSYQRPSPPSGREGETVDDFNGNNPASSPLPGYLKSETIKEFWTPVDKTECSWDVDGRYGMGWAVVPGVVRHGACRDQRFYVSHTGGAIGGSSVLLVMPRKNGERKQCLPQGIVVTMIVNMQSVGLNRSALQIAKLFEELN